MRPHPRRARTDPTSPRAWGSSDRDGFVNNHENLRFQFDWAGSSLVNKRILVAECELDVPQRQLGTIILPPDPTPIMNARPEGYFIDEQTHRVTQDGQQRYQMDGTPRIESNSQSGSSVPLYYTNEDGSAQYTTESGSADYINERNQP